MAGLPIESGAADGAPRGTVQPLDLQSLRCYERGCLNRNGVFCEYVDRHGRKCLSAWCPDHSAERDGVHYCRRHSSVIDAMREGSEEVMPELENRAPSLVNWIANDIDGEMRALLERVRRPDETVTALPIALQPRRHGGRRWGRAWQLSHGDSVAMRIAIEVDERSDPEIAVRIDGDVVVRSIAPWIGHRLRGEWVPPHVDVAERQNFNRDLCDLIIATVGQERASR